MEIRGAITARRDSEHHYARSPRIRFDGQVCVLHRRFVSTVHSAAFVCRLSELEADSVRHVRCGNWDARLGANTAAHKSIEQGNSAHCKPDVELADCRTARAQDGEGAVTGTLPDPDSPALIPPFGDKL